ncbi:hypothetical protein [Singulisphaera sp. PoT]|uniref:hypothetical protein n=1 Tax=Singulisphaera sp. PoT TaxID=3411797 RepID=UPI003BF51FD1
MPLTYEQAWDARPDGRSREEIFRSIVDRVKERSGDTLSDAEAHAAARNLIAFCRELMGLKQDETLGHIDSIDPPVTTKNEHK